MMQEQWLTFACLMIWKMLFFRDRRNLFAETVNRWLVRRFCLPRAKSASPVPAATQLHLRSQQDAPVASLCMFKSHQLCIFRHGYISVRHLETVNYYGTQLCSAQQLNPCIIAGDRIYELKSRLLWQIQQSLESVQKVDTYMLYVHKHSPKNHVLQTKSLLVIQPYISQVINHLQIEVWMGGWRFLWLNEEMRDDIRDKKGMGRRQKT